MRGPNPCDPPLRPFSDRLLRCASIVSPPRRADKTLRPRNEGYRTDRASVSVFRVLISAAECHGHSFARPCLASASRMTSGDFPHRVLFCFAFYLTGYRSTRPRLCVAVSPTTGPPILPGKTPLSKDWQPTALGGAAALGRRVRRTGQSERLRAAFSQPFRLDAIMVRLPRALPWAEESQPFRLKTR
jgi:hypothetical protein